MSSALNTAIYSRLAGLEVMTGRYHAAQLSLAALLGVDPDTSEPTIYKGNLNNTPIVLDAQGVRKPVVTFRPSGGLPDARFRSGLLVDGSIYDFEVWTFDSAANTPTDIGGLLEALIDRRLDCPALPLAAGYESVWLEALVSFTALYDEQRNGWVGLTRYRATEARN